MKPYSVYVCKHSFKELKGAVLVLDSGNSIFKEMATKKEVAFPHEIQPLTDGKYQKIISLARINGNSADYIRKYWSGKPSWV